MRVQLLPNSGVLAPGSRRAVSTVPRCTRLFIGASDVRQQGSAATASVPCYAALNRVRMRAPCFCLPALLVKLTPLEEGSLAAAQRGAVQRTLRGRVT
ncbi:hypothetical protein NDU88_003815 [Pleurodeles waltl]|uniref:Uncharacterized protein n=1 Tax=Pleurodeles waltl TaxID=8319 RepID=A0AAV7RGA0_PLEWA|nr:hypothetical protein NDU88_003815 [Pleurodeles waltl]